MRQPILWLASGLLIGFGFVSAFTGGLVFLLGGTVIGIGTAVRNRRRLRGWSALLYGFGASVALLLSPYVIRQSPCVHSSDAGCYRAFNLAVFLAAVLLAVTGLILGSLEVLRWRRSTASQGRLAQGRPR
ncbi:MAG: hypothetical protein PVSMB9_01980 [Candidatus Dormibacteria bacterium]